MKPYSIGVNVYGVRISKYEKMKKLKYILNYAHKIEITVLNSAAKPIPFYKS